MTRWGLAFGALALLLVVVGTRAAGSSSVAAQSATPAANAGTGGTTAGDATTDPAATDPYQDFLAKLATNLGVADAAQVDAAIRTTLKQTVDERQAAGDLSTDEATAIKSRIDAADVPLGLIGGRHGGFDRGGPGGPFGGKDGVARGGPNGPFGGRGHGDFARGGPGGPFEGRDRDDRDDGPSDEGDSAAESGLPETQAPNATPSPTL